jgi:para-aminobenzoate synthetase component I
MFSRLPLIEEIETALRPEELFAVFKDQPYPFLLDSGLDPENLGRYSLMGSRPFLIFKSLGSACTTIRDGEQVVETGNPLDILGRYLEAYRLEWPEAPGPCTGGAVGYFSYDLCHFIERLPARAKDDLALPECFLGFYDLILTFDKLLRKTYIVSTGFPEVEEKARSARDVNRLEEVKRRIELFEASERTDVEPEYQAAIDTGVTANFTRAAYLQTVARTRQYIIDGDIFEVNISQRFETRLTIPPYELYRRLRRINPAPFAAYLDFGESQIAGKIPPLDRRSCGNPPY